MSYMTGRPKGALPAIVPGFSGTGCSCHSVGDDSAVSATAQGPGPVIKMLGIIFIGYFALKEIGKSFKSIKS